MSAPDFKAAMIADRIQVAVLGPDGILLHSCDTFLPLAAHIGQPILERIDIFAGLEDVILALQPEDPPFALPCLSFAFEGRTHVLNMEFWARPDGQIVWLLTRQDDMLAKVAQLQQERNDSAMLLDRIQQQEKQLRAYADRLEALNRRLDTFAYNVAHDLKAPLRAIENLSAWIGEAIATGDTAELPQYLGLMQQRVQRMEQLIADILSYARAGGRHLAPESVSVRSLLQGILDAEHPGRRATVDLPDILPILHARKTPLHQVFANLISNALKHAGGPDGHIRILHSHHDGMAHFEVADNGPGIDPKHHKDIFELFQTLGEQEGTANTGIGLAIVKKLVEEAGGQVWLRSQPGQGATFGFSWPVKAS